MRRYPKPRYKLSLRGWWKYPQRRYPRNPYVTHATRTGAVSVYVRRSLAAPPHAPVLEIASITTEWGWGAARHLYCTFARDIPAVAECVLSPELDLLLQRWGWTTAFRRHPDEPPTRVNPAFMALCPRAADYHSPSAALMALCRASAPAADAQTLQAGAAPR